MRKIPRARTHTLPFPSIRRPRPTHADASPCLLPPPREVSSSRRPAKNRSPPAFPGESTPAPTSPVRSHRFWVRAPPSASRRSSVRGRDLWIQRSDPRRPQRRLLPLLPCAPPSATAFLFYIHGEGRPSLPARTLSILTASSLQVVVQARRPPLQPAPFCSSEVNLLLLVCWCNSESKLLV